jgi:UDP-N-acetylmuramate dehydrogenase
MRLGGATQALAEVHTKNELIEALGWAEQQHLPALVIGGGSNIIFKDGYPGLVIVNRLSGFEVIEDASENATIRVAAGENWDSVVEDTVKLGLSGIEKLSAIPGTAGATPVQNVGAYGAEIADTFVELEAYDTEQRQLVTLSKADCQFAYRDSIFKTPGGKRYIITSITLRLVKQLSRPPFYESLQKYLDEHGITSYTPATIRDAVIAIRRVKLPDPAIIANTGSFFKNPIISQEQFAPLGQRFPSIPHWPVPGGRIKIAAGWLVDQAGLKGYQSHGMKVYEQNALVFVNEHASSYEDLAAFRQEVVDKVQQTFGITLEQEPELI